MIVDHRTYTLKPNRVPRYLEIFEAEGLPIQRRHLGNLIGFFVTTIGPVNQVVHLWGYADLGDMEARRAARDADPGWGEYRKKVQDMVLYQENKIVKPAPFSPIQ
ncbi:MAG: NIPSNAP family protein [Alphaproteobacteria bacterium]|nr:NIPSNAP family protein [Alphaproteobacteria bacterium]